jgi:hypothetical protein
LDLEFLRYITFEEVKFKNLSSDKVPTDYNEKEFDNRIVGSFCVMESKYIGINFDETKPQSLNLTENFLAPKEKKN